MFELSQIRCFVAVAEELHFSRAAERLDMTQPPLSRQIRLLEQQLGVQLLERSSRSVRLTAAGKAFYPEAARILRIGEEAVFAARRAASGEQGQLSIGVSPASGFSLLPQLLLRLRERLPGVTLALKELAGTAQIEALDAGEIDLGLMPPHPIGAELDSVALGAEALMLAIPAGQAERWPARPTLQSLHGKPFVMYSPFEARPFYQMLGERFARAGVVPDVIAHIGQVHTMLALVRAGMGAALVAEGAARLQFDGVTVRPMATEPIEAVGVFRRDNDNPVLALVRREILPGLAGSQAA